MVLFGWRIEREECKEAARLGFFLGGGVGERVSGCSTEPEA